MIPISATTQMMLVHAIHNVKDFSISLLDLNGLFLFWNNGAILLDGYQPNEIIGKPLHMLHPKLEREIKLSDYLLTTAAEEGRSKHIGKRLRKDGTTYWASVVFNTIFDEVGKHVGYIRIARELRDNEVD
jgi:PAS domain S-box-containing protein